MPIAITRAVSRAIAHCELTHLEPVPIDVERARAQHADYERALESLGYAVTQLAEEPDLPDSVFVEDAAVVFPEVAVITRPGATSRQPETDTVARALAPHRRLVSISAPGTLDGGDVLVLDRDVVVGDTPRSNAAGVSQLRTLLAPFGYTVRSAAITGALHLKTAVTRVAERVLLVNPSWIDHRAYFPNWIIVEVDPGEPFAANALLANGQVILSSSFPRTAERLRQVGVRVVPVPASELAKAEGGVTCCSLLID
ncbi:MAG: N(G),N(G)-dimethylarginine dimethylaminohydrolase [Gemmatimonadaceae bacterium]